MRKKMLIESLWLYYDALKRTNETIDKMRKEEENPDLTVDAYYRGRLDSKADDIDLFKEIFGRYLDEEEEKEDAKKYSEEV